MKIERNRKLAAILKVQCLTSIKSLERVRQVSQVPLGQVEARGRRAGESTSTVELSNDIT